MSKTTNVAVPLAAIREIELVGESKKSWENAAQRMVKRASAKHKNITGFEVLHNAAIVRDGKIVEYRVHAKMSYAVESDRGEE